MVNRFPGRCRVCNDPVPAGRGEWSRDGVSCLTHANARTVATPAASAPLRARLTVAGGKVVASPEGFLGGDRFEQYRDACGKAGAVFDRDVNGNTTTLDSTPTLVKALESIGFTVTLAPDLAATLQARAAEARSVAAVTDARATTVDTALRSRGLSLFPFQRIGAGWLATRPAGCLLADEMGLGKTIQALVAAPEGAPVLVVAPAVAKGVWQRETKRWRPDLRVTVLSGRGCFQWPAKGEMVVLNYDVLPEVEGVADIEDDAAFLAALALLVGLPPEGTVLVGDEAHAVKNPKAKRTLRLGVLARAVRARKGRSDALTATPLLNPRALTGKGENVGNALKAPELWTVLDTFGLAEEAFGAKGRFGWLCATGRLAEVNAGLAKVMLRRRRHDVLPELPGKLRRDEPVDIDAATLRYLDDVLAKLAAEGVNLAGAIADAESTRFKGAAFEELSRARAALATAKIPAMLDHIAAFEEAEEPLVVFSAHRAPIDVLAKREGWAVITGDTPAHERTAIEDRFQRGELRGVAATIRAGGVAITLTRAAFGLFVDKDWTPALNSQAEDRICRIGQSRGVNIICLVAKHAIDERVTELLTEKDTLIVRTVEDAAKRTASVADLAGSLESLAARATAISEWIAKPAPVAPVRTGERPNVYPGACSLCGARVEANAGIALKVDGRWMVECRPTCPPVVVKARRGPSSPQEEWAARALATLAGLDPDRARVRNDVGFNGHDGEFGHTLARQVAGGLTDGQWGAAVKLCRKYHRQVGECP